VNQKVLQYFVTSQIAIREFYRISGEIKALQFTGSDGKKCLGPDISEAADFVHPHCMAVTSVVSETEAV